jgi:hypothetical protein
LPQVPNTKAVRQAMKGDLVAAMRIVTEDLVGRAQRQVPRDEGTLAGTGTAEVEQHGQLVIGRVTFSTPYAQKQHEDLTLNHPKGGKAKYLEEPLTSEAARYTKTIADTIKRGLRNGRS